MNPGELNSRISILQETKVPDDQGGYIVTFALRVILWAKITTLTAKTLDQYEQQMPELLHRVVIRYRRDVAVTDRIQYGDRLFEQIGPPINEGERNTYLRLECQEVVADAASD